MSENYVRLTVDTMETLPVEKQAVVYGFVKHMQSRVCHKRAKSPLKKNKSVFKLFGTAKSKVTDASINHDQYLYEE